MLEKMPLSNQVVRVTFRLPRRFWADGIAVVGEFADGVRHSYFLRQTHDDGDWHMSLELAAGRCYRFRYLVDGQVWINDNHADGYEPNPLGGMDSIVCT